MLESGSVGKESCPPFCGGGIDASPSVWLCASPDRARGEGPAQDFGLSWCCSDAHFACECDGPY